MGHQPKTDPDAKMTRYIYDALNRVTSVTNAGGATNYDYDRSQPADEDDVSERDDSDDDL